MDEELQQLQGDLNFDGATYDPALDKHRLSSQFRRVWALMIDGKWRSLPEIRRTLGDRDSEAAISARLRDFRNKHGMTVDRKRKTAGVFEYRVAK